MRAQRDRARWASQRGGFLPPVLPRRMWAGGRLRWEPANPLCVGQQVQRRSSIRSVKHKAGRSGELLFVLVEHQYHNARGLALTEEHDIVYRSLRQPSATPLPPRAAAAAARGPQQPPLAGQAAWSRTIGRRRAAVPLLGADLQRPPHPLRPPVRDPGRGLPGLIVHGPLIATLLLDLLRRQLPGARWRVRLQGRAPDLRPHPFSVHGKPAPTGKTIELWAQDHEGWLTMQATATLA
jgi:3-methylfumaryl-CoA hydratase